MPRETSRDVLQEQQLTSDQNLPSHISNDRQRARDPEAPIQGTVQTGIHEEDSDGLESGDDSGLGEADIPSDDDLFDWPAPPRPDEDGIIFAEALQEQMTVSENRLIRNYEDIQAIVRRTPWEMLDDSLRHLTYIAQKVDARPELLGYFNESLAEHIRSKGNGQVGIMVDDFREWWRTGFYFPGRGDIDLLGKDRPSETASSDADDLAGDDRFDLSRVTISPACSGSSPEASDIATEERQGDKSTRC